MSIPEDNENLQSRQDQPLVSIVIPALNEERTIGEFVDACFDGLRKTGVSGQVLIVDSSTDNTAEIAKSKGAEVLQVSEKGLGRAYIEAIPHIRGKYIIMGDADLTYDFREIKPFLDKFTVGYEFIMGSRYRGIIEKDAMPALHRYFGTPLTTWILNIIYGRRFSDIHCGMRGITLDGLRRMDLKSKSWQYASEMIIKSIHLGLKTTEVPINFYKDREGRQSHFKRRGWLEPWYAGWMTLETIFTYGANFILIKPGLILFILGFLGVISLYNGEISIGPVVLSFHWMLFFLLIALVGLQSFLVGILASTLYDTERKRNQKWKSIFNFNYAFPLSFLIMVTGIANMIGLIIEYINNNLKLPLIIGVNTFRAVAGFGLILIGLIFFTFSLVYKAYLLYVPPRSTK